jgi:Na+/H+ antiporter NhaC
MSGETKQRLEFRGGLTGLILPFVVLFAGIMWLALTGRALPMAFWVPTLAGILLAILLSKDPRACASAIISGMSSEMVAIMLMAWFLAGIIAQLLKVTGLVQGLVWLGISIGLEGAFFPLVTFAIGCLLSTATGTAIGTVIALGPILYPVGVALGANPPVMVAAIVCAAYFGDNIAPVSDTTIASAYTQGTDVPKVVRTRLKYALTAAGISCVLFVLFGGGGQATANEIARLGELSAGGLVMLVVPVVLIAMMFRGVHLIVALMYSGGLGIIVGILSGLLDPSSLLVIDMEQFRVGGVIVDGINGLMDIAIFAFLLMGLVGLLERGGFLEMVTERTRMFTATPRNSELTISALLILMNLLTVASTIVIIMVGPLARKILVQENGISPERSANILDAVSAGAMCLIPYGFGPLLAYMFAGGSGMPVDFSLLSVIPFMFHGWALLGVMAFAIISGWGRDYVSTGNAEDLEVVEEAVYGA